MSTLTLEQATGIVEKALEKGRALECRPLAVAVLDAGGHLKAFAREDEAGILRPQMAIAKAWGCLGMGFGSRNLAGRKPEFLAALETISQGMIFPAPGGVLIRNADGTLLGAVGITGDTGDNDEACAMAGLEAAGLVGETG